MCDRDVPELLRNRRWSARYRAVHSPVSVSYLKTSNYLKHASKMSPKNGPPSLGGELGLNIANASRAHSRPLARVLLALFLTVTAVFVLSVHRSLSSSVYHAVPAFAQQALDECAALVALPGE